MGNNEPIKYVTFGGVQVPESSTRKVTQQNGKSTYNVWVEGAKISYSKQKTEKPTRTYYTSKMTEFDGKPCSNRRTNGYGKTTKAIFEKESQSFYDGGYTDYNPDGGRVVYLYHNSDGHSWTDVYTEHYVDTTPKIEVSVYKGIIFDANNITLSNLKGATITGSDDKDNITLNNSSNCTIDVSNANNNFFVSDNVTVVNGKNNSVKAGDNDTVTYQTHNYEANTKFKTASYEDKGTYKQ